MGLQRSPTRGSWKPRIYLVTPRCYRYSHPVIFLRMERSRISYQLFRQTLFPLGQCSDWHDFERVTEEGIQPMGSSLPEAPLQPLQGIHHFCFDHRIVRPHIQLWDIGVVSFPSPPASSSPFFSIIYLFPSLYKTYYPSLPNWYEETRVFYCTE